MPWMKIPKEHHEPFYRAVPNDPRIRTIRMFGGVCAMVNGNMFAGLWADSIIVRLPPAERKRALEQGAREFDPMERGKPSPDMVVLWPEVMKSASEMRAWIDRGLAHAATLPPKTKKPAKKPAKNKRAAKKQAAKKSAKKPAKASSRAAKRAPAKRSKTR